MRPMAFALVASLAFQASVALATTRVAVDIAPLHSIVARVMQGAGDPDLILPPGASPHGHALRPSQARQVSSADLVVWTGPALAPWMVGAVAALANSATVLAAAETEGITLLPARSGGAFETHEHGEAEAVDGTEADPHIWLDPRNATAIASAVANALSKVDPEHSALFQDNAARFAEEMATLEGEINGMLDPVRDRDFLVFHDAYQYFERRFNMEATGSIARHTGEAPGAARIARLRAELSQNDIACVFSEPQMDAKILQTVLEDADTRSASLDPVGARLAPGPALYPALLRGLASDLAACLEG